MRHNHKTRWSTLVLLALLMFPLTSFAASRSKPITHLDARVLQDVAQGPSTFWVIMREQADLSGAYTITDWKTRGEYVVKQLQTVATNSQGQLLDQLRVVDAAPESFWIVNALKVTGDSATLKEIAARDDVAEIVPDVTFSIPTPLPGKEEATIDTVEWGVNNIGAPLVWSTFGVRGEGIVVANIDTGVQFNHPALVSQFRGNQGNGVFNFNYNWYDPAHICGNPSLMPCDNNGHGTHTMGTMMGDDGAGNQIGVAPKAKWIAAKGCESNACTTSSLLSSGQWMLAPTDINNLNPRADLRPNIINNSWGNPNGSDPFYRSIVQAWVAAGMFPTFANGNSGPGCNTVGAPASYPESYGVGSYTSSNTISTFSSRGPSPFGGAKPNITAPGENIRSSWNNGSYNLISGTSMAAPHVSGAVALLWSAVPALIGNINQTRAYLDQSATDVSDLTCGGMASNNNVWGEGRLNIFAAIIMARGGVGTLSGTVRNSDSLAPISGATISLSGPASRTTTTNASGQYTLTNLPVGTYSVTVNKLNYEGDTATATILNGATTTQDFYLYPFSPCLGQSLEGDTHIICPCSTAPKGSGVNMPVCP